MTFDKINLGNQIRVDGPNGTYSEYTYHPTRNWLTSLVNRKSDDTVLSSFDYTYDNVGNRLTVTEHDGSVVSYDYDDIYQLTSETRTGSSAYSISYTYDNVGNRLTMTKNSITTDYTYNDNNQLITETIDSDTTTLYTYDDNGNLIQKTDGSNTTNYTWDWRNMLTSVSDSSDTTTYAYDGDGNRIQKTEIRGQTTETTKYINDVASPLVQVLFETDDTGDTILATYNYGNDLISMNRGGTVSYYQYDGLGSTRQLTDENEAVVASYTYDSFGNLIATSGATTNAYGFTGEQQFGEGDGLVFLRARYYDSRVGRFLSRDPIGYLGGINLYAYVGNDPTNSIDPAGVLKIVGSWPSESPRSCAERIKDDVAKTPGEAADPSARKLHCIASCRISRECVGGKFTAWIAGDWFQDPWWQGPPKSNSDPCDRKANEVGRDVSGDKGKSCGQACQDAFNKGQIPTGKKCCP